jgi:hypothetical protein
MTSLTILTAFLLIKLRLKVLACFYESLLIEKPFENHLQEACSDIELKQLL